MAQFVYDGSDADISSTSLRPSASAVAVPARPAEMDMQRSSSTAPGADKDKKDARESISKDGVAIEDLTLPRSIITRLAKGVLPPNTQIQSNAALAMSKSAVVFVNHLSNAANDHTKHALRKTIMPADVFAALEDIELPFLRERLEAEFAKFNEVQVTKRNTYRKKVAAAKKAKKAEAEDPNASMMSTATATTAELETAKPRASKKQKPNAPDDSAMDVDGDGEEPRDASDADTEPEQEQEEDEDDENAEGEDEEEDEDEEEADEEGGEEHDRLEDRAPHDDHDDALDDEDSD